MADKAQPTFKKDCLFCKFAAKEKEVDVLHEDEETITFKDHHPATEHHYLVVPKVHYGNPKSLGWEDLKLVEKLLSIGKTVLEERNASIEDSRIGFHWPPFNSIQHLHLHVISPASHLGFSSRHIYRPDSWWFVTIQWMMDHLRKMKPVEISSDTNQSVSEKQNE